VRQLGLGVPSVLTKLQVTDQAQAMVWAREPGLGR
jgi:hypothetical protein